MFWSDHALQYTFFDGPVVVASDNLSELIRWAVDCYPDEPSDLHRRMAFLTHEATQNFLGPMLERRFGSLEAAKKPTLEWLADVGSFETLARLTRHKDGCCNDFVHRTCSMPKWYTDYHKTPRCIEMKVTAEQYWSKYMGELHCSVNARHPYEVMHHSDYGRLGEGDEFRFLVPLCNKCHASVSASGPRVPKYMPESVKKWL